MNFVVQKIVFIIITKSAMTVLMATPNFVTETQQIMRPKRLIWAAPLTDSQSPFNSPKWFTGIYQGTDWTRFKIEIYRFLNLQFLGEPKPSPSHIVCGGSLLTPSVVGTAGHCISEVVEKNETFERCVKENGWEQYYAVFNGYFTEQDMLKNLLPGSWAWSSKFLVHENCGKIVSKRTKLKSRTYDFGIILLDRDITFPKPGTRVLPAYDQSDIVQMFNYIQQRESICLTIGFGSYKWKRREVFGDQSPIMMHGWRNVRSYSYCAYKTPIGMSLMKSLGYDYYRVHSDVCHTFFGKIRAQVMPGDSGGPFTCENVYVGLNSRGILVDRFKGRNPKARRSTGWAAAIAFTLQWYSAQYRESFLYYLKEASSLTESPTTISMHPFKPPVVGYFHHHVAKLNGPSSVRFPSLTAVISLVICILIINNCH